MEPSLYNTLLLVPASLLAVAFIVTGWRMLVGPNSLDRVLSLDAVVAMIQCALAVYVCWTLDTTVTNAMIVVALLGFISTVAITRFRKRDGAQ
ncbi:monovalent cation/H+ antiporter complex subunit F [Corynebacterium sp. CCM 9185]|uniref:Cation:proton antiporter n=1 Tax=Corynebacterium marambiense TaxID=2765364 RepID=A0ABS0VW59_9CORY|nr:monovalent cation/H+ antiporter complex subunit F [Corynebacterium marambiense]MBI9001019.1 cation:proton antiporter [Corynebacterium marambiense]MCK7664262.1 monovalent cation/H+ antiporter complex subunit F [Corynebacterium marambiense]MCX7543074.1 monovalent cation/H+ antiporter complex subunit F [Corynebacterium marambiense]